MYEEQEPSRSLAEVAEATAEQPDQDEATETEDHAASAEEIGEGTSEDAENVEL